MGTFFIESDNAQLSGNRLEEQTRFAQVRTLESSKQRLYSRDSV